MKRHTLPTFAILASTAIVLGVSQSPVALAAGRAADVSTTATTSVEVCGQGDATTRPSSMILTCADNGEIAEHLHWTSWDATSATATGLVSWRDCTSDCADSKVWKSAAAHFTLSAPITGPGHGSLFSKLTMHVTGSTPPDFIRDLTFDEKPEAVVAPSQLGSVPTLPPAAQRAAQPAAASGTLGYAEVEGFWVIAGGPSATAQTAAAITGAESSFLPGIIQSGVDYCGAGADRAGWGLWQITCGNSVPQFGTNFQLLDPWNNAEAAVAKYNAAGGFSPWSTYTSGAYRRFLQNVAPDTALTDPGEYVQVHATPPGTPASPAPAPGSTYGPPMPGSTPPSGPHRVVVGSSADGRMEIFAGGGDGVWHTYQTAASGGWADWANLGGPANASLALAPSADGRLELFAMNGSEMDHLYQTAASGGWSSWETFGGGGFDLALGRNADGRLELVASNGGGIYHNYQTAASAGWSGWSALTGTDGVGGPGNARLTVAPSADGRLEVFALNGDEMGHIYEQSSGSNWSGWDNGFGGGGFDLALGRNADGRLELVASNGGGIYHNYQTAASGGWSGWSSLTGTDGVPGPGNARLTVAPSADGRLEVFALNGSEMGHIYEQSSGSNWSDWDNGFGGGGTDLALGRNADGRLELAASNGGGLYHNYQTAASGGWSGWFALTGPDGGNGPGIN